MKVNKKTIKNIKRNNLLYFKNSTKSKEKKK
jgi:hypothetical protein